MIKIPQSLDKQIVKIYDDSINLLIQSLSVPCILIYPSTKFENCTNCDIYPDSPNPYLKNKSRICNICNGEGKIPVFIQETVNLAVIYDFNKLKPITDFAFISEGQVQTLCKIELLEKIMSCQYAILENKNKDRHFKRVQDPTPVGLKHSFIMTLWELIN